MEAKITIREGCPEYLAQVIGASTPLADPDHWVTRTDAANRIGVNPRTIDRYVRRRLISTYTGPVLDRTPVQSGHGVRLWLDDVVNFRDNVTVEVETR